MITDSISTWQEIVNRLGVLWPEDLSLSFIDQLRVQGVKVVTVHAAVVFSAQYAV